MKSKICGISDLKTLEFLTNYSKPPEFIGFIVNYLKSKRYVELNKLKQLLKVDKKNSLYVAVLVKPDQKILEEIKFLKVNKVGTILDSYKFELSKQKIDNYLNRELNETDWNVLLILLDNPMVLNKEIAEKSNMSIDGIGSSLRRMYDYFEITETKYKKVALIHKAANISEGK